MDSTTINNPSRFEQGRHHASQYQDDSKDDVEETQFQMNTTKKDSTLAYSLEDLQETLVLNTDKLVEVLDRIQDREDARHRELIHIEREKIEAYRENSQALVGALQSMTNVMAVLGQSLSQSLPHQ